MSRYWLVQLDNEYIISDDGGYTLLKTKAGRLRNRDIDEMKEVMLKAGLNMNCVTFVPTTYKPVGSEFITPMIWWWIFPE